MDEQNSKSFWELAEHNAKVFKTWPVWKQGITINAETIKSGDYYPDGVEVAPKELIGCPFCGGQADILSEYHENDTVSPVCRDCGCSSGTYKTEEEAIEGWNRRIGDEG